MIIFVVRWERPRGHVLPETDLYFVHIISWNRCILNAHIYIYVTITIYIYNYCDRDGTPSLQPEPERFIVMSISKESPTKCIARDCARSTTRDIANARVRAENCFCHNNMFNVIGRDRVYFIDTDSKILAKCWECKQDNNK